MLCLTFAQLVILINFFNMSSITVRIPDDLEAVLNEFCEEEDRSKSWVIKKALAEKLENWQDLRIAIKERDEYEKNPEIAISHENLLRELGIKDSDLK